MWRHLKLWLYSTTSIRSVITRKETGKCKYTGIIGRVNVKLGNQRLGGAYSATIGCKKLPHKVLFCFKELVYIPSCSFLTYNEYMCIIHILKTVVGI